MNIEKMRAAFEAAILADGKSIRRCEDSYHFGTVHRKWLFWQKAWQASREAVVVDFSPVRQEADNYSYGGEEAVFHAAVKAIEDQGLKVRP